MPGSRAKTRALKIAACRRGSGHDGGDVERPCLPHRPTPYTPGQWGSDGFRGLAFTYPAHWRR